MTKQMGIDAVESLLRLEKEVKCYEMKLGEPDTEDQQKQQGDQLKGYRNNLEGNSNH